MAKKQNREQFKSSNNFLNKEIRTRTLISFVVRVTGPSNTHQLNCIGVGTVFYTFQVQK